MTDSLKLTDAQKNSVNRIEQQYGRQPDDQGWAGIGSDTYYYVVYNKMFIGIESDGHSHT